MAITVEDGTGVTGADSYTTLADARAYLLLFGWALNTDDTVAEQQLRQGTVWIESYRQRFQGCKTAQANPLQWPRDGVYIDGFLVDSDAIPKEVVNAQVLLALEIEEGGDPGETLTGQSIKSEGVEGAIDVEYFDRGKGSDQEVYTKPLESLSPTFSHGQARTVRG